MKDVMILTLQYGMNNQHELFRIKKDSFLRLLIGHTLQGKSLRIFTNYPMTSNKFIRDSYSELDIINPTSSQNEYDSFDNYTEFKSTLSGAFQFYFTADGSSEISNKIGEGYFIIDPRFTFDINSKHKKVHFELDGIVLQTYLAKNLGPFSQWNSRIQAALDGNYNMIHFTPLQELGYSRSAYSLRDQLRLNPDFSVGCSPSSPVTWDMVEDFIQDLYQTHHCLSMTDLVYNHSSNDSPWIHKHPECAYSVVNSPHLRPAYLLDRVIWNLTVDVANLKYTHRSLSNMITRSDQVDILRSILLENINELRLHEFYLAHIDNEVASFKQLLIEIEQVGEADNIMKPGELVMNHRKYQRLQSGVDHSAVAYHFYRSYRDIDAACIRYREVLHNLNDKMYHDIQSHMQAAVGNVVANINYRFIDEHGLKLAKVTVDQPLMWNYFYHPHPEVILLKDCEERMDDESRIMAFNGWVMNDNPLSNFAESNANVYLRRELIVWGDSVKLRYGNGPEDCPYLWSHMFEYTELTARMFHAIRLDNCHGTPIHVAQAMLDRARAVRPDLYIVAELFTGSEEVDNIFVNKLGINSLIREAQSAWNANEQGRLVHRYGGFSVGAFVQQNPRQLRPSTAHALFYDMTHDNESPICKRSPFDILPTAAIVGMACCAVGSTRGYDELVPHYIDVVNESRLYSQWNQNITMDSGIVRAKSLINRLHKYLAVENYNQVFVDQISDNIVAITRQNSSTYKSVVMVAHTAFSYPGHKPGHGYVRDINISGKISRILFEAQTTRDESQVDSFQKDSTFINGLPGIQTSVAEQVLPSNSTMISIHKTDDGTQEIIRFHNFPAGSIIAIETELSIENQESIDKFNNIIATQFNARLRSSSMGQCLINELMVKEQMSKDIAQLTPLREILSQLKIVDLNRLLYRCHEEENADFPGNGSYDVPGFGRFVFCGLQGLVSELNQLREHNDLGHPICNHIRDGNWIMDYVSDRLIRYGGLLKDIGNWFRVMFNPIKTLPRYMIPSLFEVVISCAYKLTLEECFYRLGDNIVFGSSFLKNLSLGSIMLCSVVRNCKLPPLAEENNKERCTLSAGFPHFAEGIWRNWGRDTFIALKGMTILTNRYEEARSIIMTYGATVRHGLIPNLLGDGLVARYNARDATWFWLNSIKEYELSQSKLGTNGISILHMPVARMYSNDQDDGTRVKQQPLYDVIQEILQRHADGIKFTERNAGPRIDEHMDHQGFHLKIGIRNSVKFPYGGNERNCGTWMDKMGSCSKSGNKGYPATPRDGSAVEIVGLCASVIEWLIEATAKRQYPYSGVHLAGNPFTWNDWYNDLKQYFDDMFFIPLDTTDSNLIHNRGIYRDTVNSSHGFTDYQFRPNFLVAMTVAPYLFDVEHAWHALKRVEKELLGPIGMKTLSPDDWAYHGYYDNSNDSYDRTVAHGFNYHQGPEWVWLTGYYLQAKLIFCHKVFQIDVSKYSTVIRDTIAHVQLVLGRLHNFIKNSKWQSLPELTNKDGEYCPHSCEAQAWSIASTLEALTRLLSLAD